MNAKRAAMSLVVSRIVWVLVFAVMIGGSGLSSYAQGPTATILGRVSDPTGAAVAGASVFVENTGTGLRRLASTTAEGDYLVPSLPVGTYTLNITAQGFKAFSDSGIRVEVGQSARVDAHLQIGATNETIQVSSTGLQVDTASAALRSEVDNTQIEELPLNTRNVLQLITLVPGVGTSTTAGAGSSSLPTVVTNQRSGPVLNVNGSRSMGSEVTLDGTVLTTSLYNRAVNLPSPDSIGEFQLLTNSYGAEYGRSSGGVFVAVSKSGMNTFHGAMWEFLRNDDLNARNAFAPAPAPKPVLKQNQFGAAFGGPIVKDKTFFYFTYEGLRIRQVSLQTFGSLTAAQRTGDFSTTSKQLTDPSTGLPYPNNQIPTSAFDPMAVNFINAYLPVSNPVTGLVNAQYPIPVTGDQFTFKIDHHVSASDLASVRFFRTNETSPQFNGNVGTTASTFSNLNQGISVRDTHIFRPNLVGDFGFSDTNLETLGGKQIGGQSPQQLGGSYAQDGPAPESPLVVVAGQFASEPIFPWLERSSLKQFDASVSWVSGRHDWQIGIRGLHQTQRLTAQYLTSGLDVFAGTFTGDALADFLIGRPVSFSQGSILNNTQHTMGYGVFAQDNVKITSRLTLNLGLRYELMTPWTEEGLKTATVIFNSSYQSKRFPTAAPGYAFPGDPGIPDGIYPMDKLDFAPRIGFAYDVFGDGKTAVRGGYGIFYNPPAAITIATANSTAPFNQFVSFFPNTLSDPYGTTFTSPFPFTFDPSHPIFSYPAQLFAPSPLLKNAYVQQYNWSVQHQFAEDFMLQVAFVGSHGDRLWYARDGNSAPWVPGATASNAQSRRPFENQFFAGIGVTYPDGSSNYNSLQVTARRRFSKSYTMQLAYTYSKSLDNGSSPTTDATTVQNPANPFGEYGLSDFDQRHLFRLNGVWDLPRLSNWGVARHVVGGWELSGILNHSSGVPFSVTTGSSALWLGSSTLLGPLRLNTTGTPCVGCGTRTQWTSSSVSGGYFDPTAFATPPDGQFGNSGRNSFIGPSYFDTDLSLAKNFNPFRSEAFRIQFRADLFNLFNNVDFNNPVNTNSSSNFGKIISAGPARQIQFALRFDF
jgi:Carboxypeptidase regulatory-like domain/TonB dependent receptor